MITHEALSKHLRQAGFRIGRVAKAKKQFAAISDDRGVMFRWNVCSGSLCNNLHSHIHMTARIRTAAGATFRNSTDPFIPSTFEEIDEYRGAPAKRTKVTKKQMPEPFQFKIARSVVDAKGRHTRNITISAATLLGPVGIADNAKISEDMAAVPDEPIWWHFDCTGPSSATFNIITDGEVWYPVNRRSLRITTQLKPKRSIDLSTLSADDHSFLIHIISDYISKL